MKGDVALGLGGGGGQLMDLFSAKPGLFRKLSELCDVQRLCCMHIQHYNIMGESISYYDKIELICMVVIPASV